VSGSFDDQGRLVIGDGKILACFGKKRSGKSVMGKLLLASYAGDRMVIAANADDGPFADGETVHLVRGDVESLPAKWPEHLRRYQGEPMTLRVEVDPGSPTFLEDQDHAVGMALRHGNCAILVHEVGLIAPSNRVPPHMRRLLHANRHRRVTAILCGPRPITADPLVLAQADVVYIFETPVPDDRKRIAGSIGWKPADLDDALEELRRHEYLRFDANEPKPEGDQEDMRLVHYPALPEDIVRAALRA